MVRLITAEDVRAAARAGVRSVSVEAGTIVTPLARDEAAERGVALAAEEAASSTGPLPPPGAADHPRRITRTPTDGLALDPFPFPVPPQMDVRLRDVVTAADGSPVAAGVMSLRAGSFPWELTYDEVQFVLEGELHLGTEHGTIVGRPGDVLYVPKGTELTFGTPSSTRFLYVTYPAEWGGEAAEDAGGDAEQHEPDEVPAWDVPGRFPVVLEGDVPACVTCGGQLRDKPSHLTQLDPRYFAPKTDARIRLRGRLDSLQALALLTAARATADGWSDLADHLGSVAAYCRELLAAEYHLRSPGALRIAGLDEADIHHASHHPEEVVGLDHLVPDGSYPEVLHWLNLLRCQVREAEVAALDAFPPEHHPGTEGGPIAGALNRLSSAVYYLELRSTAAHRSGGSW